MEGTPSAYFFCDHFVILNLFMLVVHMLVLSDNAVSYFAHKVNKMN